MKTILGKMVRSWICRRTGGPSVLPPSKIRAGRQLEDRALAASAAC